MAELFEALGIEPGMIAVNITGFLLLVLLLKKFAFGPIGDFMADREREIAANIEEAERARETAVADMRAAEQELDNLNKRADEIIARAKRDADRERRDILKHAGDQSRQIIEEGERAVEHAANEARRQLRIDTAEVAIEISERALRDALNEERQRSLVDAFISDIERIAASRDEGERP